MRLKDILKKLDLSERVVVEYDNERDPPTTKIQGSLLTLEYGKVRKYGKCKVDTILTVVNEKGEIDIVIILKKRRRKKKMKKIIGSILYDTDRAEKIAEWSNEAPGQFNMKETLYRGKNGRYFFSKVNMLGAMLGSMGKTIPPGVLEEELEPTTEEKAKDWVGNKLGVEEYTRLFGEPEEA